MPVDVSTCPTCGALITPQLARCRQCQTYLHGTKLEGFVFEHLLPERLQGSPGTGLILIMILLYYGIMVTAAGLSSALSFSSFSLQQLGATHGVSILLGQYWRVVTANFLHHDIAHLAFNVWALLYVGPLVEEVFDRKKMIMIFLISGTAAMGISHGYYTYLRGDVFVTSGGASGAISGLIGAAFFVAWRMGPAGHHVFQALKRWIVIMALLGFVLNVNNAAHLGGFLVGIGSAYIVPLGITKTVGGQRILSAIVFTLLAGGDRLYGPDALPPSRISRPSGVGLLSSAAFIFSVPRGPAMGALLPGDDSSTV